MIGKQN